MSGIFSKPKMPNLPEQEAPVEDVKMVTEEAEVARRRERKRLLKGGRRATILSGIQAALHKRLGE